jgi:hypothetical protein
MGDTAHGSWTSRELGQFIAKQKMGALKTFRVKVYHGVTEHHVVIDARSAEEAMEQALLVLHLTYKDVQRMEVVEQRVFMVCWLGIQTTAHFAVTNRSPKERDNGGPHQAGYALKRKGNYEKSHSN